MYLAPLWTYHLTFWGCGGGRAMYFHLTPSPIPSKKCITHKKQASNNLLFDDGKAVFYLRILPKSSL